MIDLTDETVVEDLSDVERVKLDTHTHGRVGAGAAPRVVAQHDDLEVLRAA